MSIHYLIDGYNLFFRTTSGGDGPDFTKEREKIISRISNEVDQAGLKASLIFDSAWHEGPEERKCKGTLEIHYTNKGESADDWIISRVKRDANPAKIIVVTSDRKLAWRARLKGASTLAVEEFIHLLRRLANKKKQAAEKAERARTLLPTPKPPSLNERYESIFNQDLPKQKIKKVEKPLTDNERWLKAFENGA